MFVALTAILYNDSSSSSEDQFFSAMLPISGVFSRTSIQSIIGGKSPACSRSGFERSIISGASWRDTYSALLLGDSLFCYSAVRSIYVYLVWGALQAAGVSPRRATSFTPLALPPITLSRASGIPFNPSLTNSTLLG